MFLVELLNNAAIYGRNVGLIKKAFNDQLLNKEQYHILLLNNKKWFETCNHKGLLFKENDNFFYVTRTSSHNKLELPNLYYKNQSLQYLGKVKVCNKKQYAESIIFNKNCNIMNRKWLLGNNSTNIVEYRSLEDRPEIVSKLVGTNDDLEKLKILVKNLDLKEYDISPYFNIEKTIDELAFFNINNPIRDE